MNRPFDEARYRVLLEGLEVTVLPLSKVYEDNIAFRIDSEFNLKPHLAIIEQLRKLGAERFGDSAPAIIHPYEIEREYVEEGGVWFFRAQNLRPLEISENDKVFVSAADATRLERNRLQANDLIITRTGANAGDCALFNVDEDALASSHTFIIRSGTWPHHFLAAFLNSYYGRSQIMKGRYGAAQPEVAPNYLRSIWIPRFSSDFYAAIGRIFASAKERRDVAFTQLESAEQTLLRALGLSNWQPPEPLTYIRSSRDAFTTERLDAEYFYPAKQAALDLLATMPGKTVGEMFGSVRDLWQPENANQAELVRNYDLTDALSPFLDITKESTTPETISSTKKRIAKGDIVVSRLRSYLKEIAVVLDGDNISMVGSTEFIVLRPKKQSVRIETLLVYLRSTLPQLIFKWSQDGSNHPRFNEKELLNLRVPDIIIEYEDEIAEKVQSAIRSRRRAAELLEAAKRAVEIAIEDSEEAALAYLKSVKDA